MEEVDLQAMEKGLEELVRTMHSTTDKAGKLSLLAGVAMILSEFESIIERYEDHKHPNMRGILGEIRAHAKSLAGIMPSYNLDEEMHLRHALNSISKLSYPTAFDF